MPARLFCACEGITDEAVVRRLLRWVGTVEATIKVTSGKEKLLREIPTYGNIARLQRCFALVDLDRENCVPEALRSLGAEPSSLFCLRYAVRAVESWLMADREGIAGFLSVGINRIPVAPDLEEDPVSTVITIARRSRKRWVKEDIVPRPGSGRKRGPGYAGRMIEFIGEHWDIDVARRHSPSLDRAINCLHRLMKEAL